MLEFLHAVRQYTFLQYALLAGLLSGVACGVVGTYVVTRRISYIAGGISHCVLAGMGAARYGATVYGWTWLSPLHGATIAALGAAAIIGVVSLRAKQREDTVIGALWAVGMAVGVLFIARTPGYNEDLMGYLFGNILMVSGRDLLLICALDAVVVAAGVVWYDQFLAICFDEEFARLRGVPVEWFYLLLLGLTALTVVLLISVVGVVLVIALLTLPAAIAGHFARTLRGMMLLATLLCALFTVSGLALRYAPNLPAGATIIVIAGAAYLLTAGLRTFVRIR
ncbi:MAG: metal ABC transporter permease [Candidatus Hydrogenedentes bacterium]|nr:metal ABC transporter permease [Candidatus Hydrogenedentota bacterium]